MNNNNSNYLTMLVGSVSAVVTVAVSSGAHDLSDTIIGFIIGVLMWPLIKSKKSNHTRILISAIAGLCVLLIIGFVVDEAVGITKFHYSHFLVWSAASIILYFALPLIERKYNKSSNSDGKSAAGS